MSSSETMKIKQNWTMQIWHCSIFLHLSQRQIAFLGPLEWRNLLGAKNKVFSHKKLVFRSGVWVLFLFVLTDAILLNLNLQQRTYICTYSVKSNMVSMCNGKANTSISSSSFVKRETWLCIGVVKTCWYLFDVLFSNEFQSSE